MRVPLRRCDLCLGVLADPSSVAVAGTYYHANHYVMSEGHGRQRCRNCSALFKQTRQRCHTCHTEQAIGCVRCLMPMQVLEVAGVALDVCRPCRMVWFDRGELGLLVKRHSAALQRGLFPAAGPGFPALVGDVVLANPDVVPLGLHGAHAVAEVAIGAVSELSASGAVEVVAAAGEGAAEVGGAVIDVVVGIVGGIFS
jgi:hypothetical protein